MHASARDAYAHSCASARALAFGNASAASAAPPARYHACVARQQACPLGQLSHTLGAPTCHTTPAKTLPPWWASTGRMPTTMCADQPRAQRTGSFSCSHIALRRSMPGARPCARAVTGTRSRWAWHAIQGLLCRRCARMIALCAFPSSRCPWRSPAQRFPPAGPQRSPLRRTSRSHCSSPTATSSPRSRPQAPPGAPWRNSANIAGAWPATRSGARTACAGP